MTLTLTMTQTLSQIQTEQLMLPSCPPTELVQFSIVSKFSAAQEMTFLLD